MATCNTTKIGDVSITLEPYRLMTSKLCLILLYVFILPATYFLKFAFPRVVIINKIRFAAIPGFFLPEPPVHVANVPLKPNSRRVRHRQAFFSITVTVFVVRCSSCRCYYKLKSERILCRAFLSIESGIILERGNPRIHSPSWLLPRCTTPCFHSQKALPWTHRLFFLRLILACQSLIVVGLTRQHGRGSNHDCTLASHQEDAVTRARSLFQVTANELGEYLRNRMFPFHASLIPYYFHQTSCFTTFPNLLKGDFLPLFSAPSTLLIG
jgi:hypothetical protein